MIIRTESFEVLEVGSKVGDFQVGDHVVSLFCPNWQKGEPEPFNLSGIPGDNKDGFAAEVVSERASAFTKIPEGYSLSEAATLPCAPSQRSSPWPRGKLIVTSLDVLSSVLVVTLPSAAGATG